MHWTLQLAVALLNILWIAFFLTPEPFSVFVQRRSTDEDVQFLPPVTVPSNKTNNTNTTFQDQPAPAPGSEATTKYLDEIELTNPGRPRERNHRIAPDDCCFDFYPRRVNKKYISAYYFTAYSCQRSGVILVTSKSRHICADPTVAWVMNIIKDLDNKGF